MLGKTYPHSYEIQTPATGSYPIWIQHVNSNRKLGKSEQSLEKEANSKKIFSKDKEGWEYISCYLTIQSGQGKFPGKLIFKLRPIKK